MMHPMRNNVAMLAMSLSPVGQAAENMYAQKDESKSTLKKMGKVSCSQILSMVHALREKIAELVMSLSPVTQDAKQQRVKQKNKQILAQKRRQTNGICGD